MKTTHTYQHIEYTLSNEDLKEGDKVFPISNGIAKDGVYTHEKFDFREFLCGFPNDPHIIKNLHHSDEYKPYEIRTNYGYGPKESYFKIVSRKDLMNDLAPSLQKYYRKKYAKENDYPIIYVVKSTREGVIPPVARQVVNIKREVSKCIYAGEIDYTYIHRYYLEGEYPYEVDIREDEICSLDEGYGSGCGDLWEWTYYCTFEETDANEYFKKESIRIAKEYPNEQKEILKSNNMQKLFVGDEKYPEIAGKIRAQLRDYLEKSGLKSLVIGVSGGIDSAVVVALAKPICDELQVVLIGRSLSIKTNSKDEIYRAYAIGKEFCHNFEEIDLAYQFDALISIDDSDSTDVLPYLGEVESVQIKNDKIRSGNIKARLRMMYLYNLASKYKGMVLGTENLTEENLAFFTIGGDEVSDFEMIKDLWKTEVYGLADYLSTEKISNKAKMAMLLCINADATDGLGISNTDLDQILPDWKERHNTTRSAYKEVDEIFIEYFDLANSDSIKSNRQILLESSSIIIRHKANLFKHNRPYVVKRNTILDIV